MKHSDYKCMKCGHIQDIWYRDSDEFDEYATCYKCGNKSKRMLSASYSIVHQGKCGNYKNNYTSSPVSIKKT